jgi:hypothetical protein
MVCQFFKVGVIVLNSCMPVSAICSALYGGTPSRASKGRQLAQAIGIGLSVWYLIQQRTGSSPLKLLCVACKTDITWI